MATSFLGSLGGAAASAGTSLAINKIFGQDVKPFAQSVSNLPPTTFNSGGLNFGFNGSQIVGGASGARQGLVGQNASFFSQQAQELEGLKNQVTPGFGALTNARVQAIQNARQRSIGNLRDSLARRRVSGSSFGEDAIARAEAEFAQEEAEARATSFLQELDLKTQLIDRQFTASRGAVDAFLNELNLEADIAKQLAVSSNAVLADNAKFAASLLARQAADDNALLGDVSSGVADIIGQGASSLIDGGSLSSLFGGGSSGTAAAAGNASAGLSGAA